MSDAAVPETEPQKTKAINFSRRYKMHNMNVLAINNVNIQIVEKIGLIFDKKLSWKHHIEYIVKQSEIRLNIIRYITKRGGEHIHHVVF